jgi:hypothetical protein
MRKYYSVPEIIRMRKAIGGMERHGGWSTAEIEQQIQTYIVVGIAPEEIEVERDKELAVIYKELDAWTTWLNEHPEDHKKLIDAQRKAFPELFQGV